MTLREKVAGTPGSIARTSRCPDMTSPAPAAMPAANGGRSCALQRGPALREHRQFVVAVGGGVAVAGEVLEGGRDPAALQAPDRRADLRGDGLRVGAERAGADHRAAVRSEHVGDRREVHVDPHRGELGAADPPGGLGQRRLAGRAERHRGGQRGHARRGPG